VRYNDKPRVLLQEVTPTDKGLLLRFNAKLDTKLATDPAVTMPSAGTTSARQSMAAA